MGLSGQLDRLLYVALDRPYGPPCFNADGAKSCKSGERVRRGGDRLLRDRSRECEISGKRVGFELGQRFVATPSDLRPGYPYGNAYGNAMGTSITVGRCRIDSE